MRAWLACQSYTRPPVSSSPFLGLGKAIQDSTFDDIDDEEKEEWVMPKEKSNRRGARGAVKPVIEEVGYSLEIWELRGSYSSGCADVVDASTVILDINTLQTLRTSVSRATS